MKLTDEQKGDPHCHYFNHESPEPIYDDGFNSITCYPDGTVCMEFDEDGKSGADWSGPGTIQYCPICGRRLDGTSK